MTGNEAAKNIFFYYQLHLCCLSRTEKRKTGGITHEKSYYNHTIH